MVRETSIETYHKIKASGILSRRRWEVYDILFYHGPMTSNETFEYSKLKGVNGYRHNANARMTELRDMGAAKELGTKKCSVTGQTVILWDVTSKFPRHFKKEIKETSKQKIKRLEEELFELRSSLCKKCANQKLF